MKHILFIIVLLVGKLKSENIISFDYIYVTIAPAYSPLRNEDESYYTRWQYRSTMLSKYSIFSKIQKDWLHFRKVRKRRHFMRTFFLQKAEGADPQFAICAIRTVLNFFTTKKSSDVKQVRVSRISYLPFTFHPGFLQK